MTIIELLNISADNLKSKGFNNPRTSCETLLAYSLGVKRLDLYLNYDRPVADDERKKFRELLKRRLNHEPLQYITGETEFMSLPFKLNNKVLIPRPETELVVENTIKIAKNKWGNDPVRIIDIGVGSGNIPVSLAHYLPNAKITGFDISSDAVETAQKNAGLNNVAGRVDFFVKDIFESGAGDYSGVNIVISNPPYVADQDRDILEKEVVDHEPHEALFAGDDGLRFFRVITELAINWLAPGGLLVYETGYDIGTGVKTIVSERGFINVILSKDYAGLDRQIIAEKPV